MQKIIEYADVVTSEKLAKDICDIMEKASDEPWFQDAMDEGMIAMHYARDHYASRCKDSFKPKTFSVDECKDISLKICNFILNTSDATDESIFFALQDLYECAKQLPESFEYDWDFDGYSASIKTKKKRNKEIVKTVENIRFALKKEDYKTIHKIRGKLLALSIV